MITNVTYMITNVADTRLQTSQLRLQMITNVADMITNVADIWLRMSGQGGEYVAGILVCPFFSLGHLFPESPGTPEFFTVKFLFDFHVLPEPFGITEISMSRFFRITWFSGISEYHRIFYISRFF